MRIQERDQCVHKIEIMFVALVTWGFAEKRLKVGGKEKERLTSWEQRQSNAKGKKEVWDPWSGRPPGAGISLVFVGFNSLYFIVDSWSVSGWEVTMSNNFSIMVSLAFVIGFRFLSYTWKQCHATMSDSFSMDVLSCITPGVLQRES
jgi:hypothetical protein